VEQGFRRPNQTPPTDRALSGLASTSSALAKASIRAPVCTASPLRPRRRGRSCGLTGEVTADLVARQRRSRRPQVGRPPRGDRLECRDHQRRRAPIHGTAKETRRGMRNASGHVTAYRVVVDARPASTLTKLWSYSAPMWTAVEFGGTTRNPTITVVCAIRGGERPGAKAPLPGLSPQRGRHGPVVDALYRCRSIGWTPRRPNCTRDCSGSCGGRPGASGSQRLRRT